MVSKFSDNESRISTLEAQFEAFNTSLNNLKRQSRSEAKYNAKIAKYPYFAGEGLQLNPN